MTLAELHERIGWQLEGRLQHKVVTPRITEWEDVPLDCDGLTPSINGYADWYRRRPDPPPMPDEVWLSTRERRGEKECHDAWPSEKLCHSNYGDAGIRYIRADGILDGSKLEFLSRSTNKWLPAGRFQYRFKP